MEKEEVIEYYCAISGTYERRRLNTDKDKMISELQIQWFDKNITDADTCLEVGCGTGRLTEVLVKKARHLIATDATPNMIKINRNKMSGYITENRIQYIICEASHLPFRNETFNYTFGGRVFWHIQDYPRALKEALRVLNTKGSLLFDFPSILGPFSLYSKILRVQHEVLTLFTNGRGIEQILKDARHLSICGNISAFLYFLPSRLLRIKLTNKLIYLFELLNQTFLKNLIFSYYLIKATK